MKSAGVFGCLSKVLATAVFFVMAGVGPLHLFAEAGDYRHEGQKEQIKQNIKIASASDSAVSEAFAAIEAVEQEEIITESSEENEIQKADSIAKAHVEFVPVRAVEPAQLNQKSDSAVSEALAEIKVITHEAIATKVKKGMATVEEPHAEYVPIQSVESSEATATEPIVAAETEAVDTIEEPHVEFVPVLATEPVTTTAPGATVAAET